MAGKSRQASRGLSPSSGLWRLEGNQKTGWRQAPWSNRGKCHSKYQDSVGGRVLSLLTTSQRLWRSKTSTACCIIKYFRKTLSEKPYSKRECL